METLEIKFYNETKTFLLMKRGCDCWLYSSNYRVVQHSICYWFESSQGGVLFFYYFIVLNFAFVSYDNKMSVSHETKFWKIGILSYFINVKYNKWKNFFSASSKIKLESDTFISPFFLYWHIPVKHFNQHNYGFQVNFQ